MKTTSKLRKKNNVVSIDRSKLIVHPDIVAVYPNLIDVLKNQAAARGLNTIDFDGYYELIKTKSKNAVAETRYPKGTLVAWARPFIVGDQNHVSLILHGSTKWFRLSEVKKCQKLRKHYKIETLNSTYSLKRVDI